MWSTQVRAETSTDVKIGYSALRISLPIFVAAQKGFFSKEGLNVTLERFDTAQPMMESLVAGNIQMAGYTALPITYSAMLRSRTPLYFTTALLEDQHHRLSYLIVPSQAPKGFKLSDLKGKRIGILPTVAYKVWLEEILKAGHVLPQDVSIVQINPALSVSALQSGQVDALFTNDPAATTILRKGVGRLLSEKVELPSIFGEPFLFGSFNIRKDFADQNLDVSKKIIRALDRSIQFVMTHEKEAKEIMKQYLPDPQKPFVDYYPNAFYQKSTQTNPLQFQRAADQYRKLGIIDAPLAVSPLVLKAP